ncbi:hypothetical protein BVRB_6g140270 [Beta vulgaris subsp. vulgaris]|uniref:Uncharacterized protein n=1 Tax=Beta vulgaris subsp. vulgaris TaxID=3555 RepID=A0A0J8EYZ8_BETVV|nr:hypothetical protein BVRB_6g140270 [Beta vulgaris subsp. vulgaris]
MWIGIGGRVVQMETYPEFIERQIILKTFKAIIGLLQYFTINSIEQPQKF